MKKTHAPSCSICGRSVVRRDLVPGTTIQPAVADRIRTDHPEWSPEGYVCREDLNRYRYAYVQSLLESERGELGALDREVLRSLHEHQLLAKNLEASMEADWSWGERLADRVARFGGSWTFLILFLLFILAWIAMNTVVLLARPVDPYPFILLNLVLSCIASIQAPVIMMSQNRQAAKDRLRAQNDYQVNLKAELEIRHLHEKVDHLLLQQWERLTKIQEIQLDVLSELGRR